MLGVLDPESAIPRPVNLSDAVVDLEQ